MVACLQVDLELLSMNELAMSGVKINRGEVFELPACASNNGQQNSTYPLPR